MDTSQNDLLRFPVSRMLLLMTAPISVGMLSTFLFQVVDTYLVGKLGPGELAALGFSTPILSQIQACIFISSPSHIRPTELLRSHPQFLTACNSPGSP